MSERLNAAFRENIARLLARRGWSQNKLAERMDVTKGYVSQLLSGKFGVGLEAIDRVAEAFEVEPHTLIKEPRPTNRAG